MRTDWKRSMAVLLGTGVIALTAACGAEVAGAAQGGIPAVAGTESSQEVTSSGESSDEVTTSESEEEPAPSDSVPEPSPEPTSESAEPTSESAEPTSESAEPGGNNSVPATPSPESETTSTETSESPSSASSGSDADYAFMKDYCTLMPKSYTAGLEKDTTRAPDQSCTYLSPDSSDAYGFVSVGGGFSLSYEDLDESYNVDLAKVKIDGRDGFTWTNSSKSNYSALFNLPKQDGGEMSILVVFGSDGSPAEMKKQALALLTEISPKVPR